MPAPKPHIPAAANLLHPAAIRPALPPEAGIFAAAKALTGRLFHGLVSGLLARASLRRQRRRLAELDDRLLRDIGLNREEAEAEARRASWDPPGHWL